MGHGPQDQRSQGAQYGGALGVHPARHHDPDPGHRQHRKRRPRTIPDVSIKPFTIGHPAQTIDFPEQTLATPTQFRTSGAGLTGVTQQMVNNPNTVLRSAIGSQHFKATTTLHVASRDAALPGGGTSNIAFLAGTKDGPNAVAARVTATFWLGRRFRPTPNRASCSTHSLCCSISTA